MFRGLLEAYDEARDLDEALEVLEAEIDEHLPEYVLDDGTDEPANARERVEYAGAEIERLRRERDEAREALRLSVSAWEAAGMQGRSAHDGLLALQRRAEQTERERDEAIARAERAEAALAALREAAAGFAHAMDMGGGTDLARALADTADAAVAHDRRVRAEAVRKVREAVVALEAARPTDQAESSADTLKAVAEMLATMASEIERGER